MQLTFSDKTFEISNLVVHILISSTRTGSWQINYYLTLHKWLGTLTTIQRSWGEKTKNRTRFATHSWPVYVLATKLFFDFNLKYQKYKIKNCKLWSATVPVQPTRLNEAKNDFESNSNCVNLFRTWIYYWTVVETLNDGETSNRGIILKSCGALSSDAFLTSSAHLKHNEKWNFGAIFLQFLGPLAQAYFHLGSWPQQQYPCDSTIRAIVGYLWGR